jgi:hypothetical protein
MEDRRLKVCIPDVFEFSGDAVVEDEVGGHPCDVERLALYTVALRARHWNNGVDRTVGLSYRCAEQSSCKYSHNVQYIYTSIGRMQIPSRTAPQTTTSYSNLYRILPPPPLHLFTKNVSDIPGPSPRSYNLPRAQ